MARVSRIKIDKNLEIEIFNQFWRSLANINSSLKSSDFFSDLLSETEKLMLAKRFATAVLIYRSKTATEIHDSLHVSYSTIGSVSAWVKNGKPKTLDILKTISNEKGWGAVIDKMESVLDSFKPRRHSDWKEEYKKKQGRLNERLTIKSLR